MKTMRVAGVMSGTSLDGIDAAFLVTDGRGVATAGPALTVPYPAALRESLRGVLGGVGAVAAVERTITEAHAEAVRRLIAEHDLAADLIGFHGHTILHRPEQGRTWQIGDGALLARLTGIDVINDFRSADVKAGGQGAPLMPLYHAALARKSGLAQPLVVVNIGGVAQVTYIKGDAVLAFDTGPGNAPIDDWMQRHSGKPVDEDGAFAATGKVDDGAMAKMLDHSYFDRAPPKSLDRMDFGMEAVEALSPADGAATLTAFTAASLARGRQHFSEPAATWIVSGGGRHNTTLMAMLKARVNAPVLKAEDAGWDGDALEAQGFAYLAVRSKKGLPLSLPTTTGVKQLMTGGKYWKA